MAPVNRNRRVIVAVGHVDQREGRHLAGPVLEADQPNCPLSIAVNSPEKVPLPEIGA
jgi:hypothetical protein